VGSGEGCGGGAVMTGDDQLGDVVLVEELAHAPWVLSARLWVGHGPVSATLARSGRSAACAECE
jgi:hypothetical protein